MNHPDNPSNSINSKIVYWFFMYISIENKSPVLHEGKTAMNKTKIAIYLKKNVCVLYEQKCLHLIYFKIIHNHYLPQKV